MSAGPHHPWPAQSLRRISCAPTSTMFHLRARALLGAGKRNLLHRHYLTSKTSTRIVKPILFGDEAAPPVRFVAMTAFALGVQLEHRKIDLFASENRTESYRKINPLQKVPALATATGPICDSHVISLYLCREWDHSHKLYPKDAATKAKVDEILFYNSSTLFPIDSEIFTKFFAGQSNCEPKINEWTKALNFLEDRLSKYPWLAGEKMSLCDICAVCTVTSALCLIPLAEHHVRLKSWLNEFEKQPFFDINRRGVERLQKFVDIAKSEKLS